MNQLKSYHIISK